MREIGNSGLKIAPLMLGGNVFGWTADEAASFAVLDAFADAGFSTVDTADVYSMWVPGHKGGESETVLGNWMAARRNRDKIVIATKTGMLPIGGKPGLSKAQIHEACEASLKRLKTDYIDIYFAHRDHEENPLEETLEAFGALVKAGKVRVLGASNYSADRLSAALDVSAKHNLPRYDVLQPLYNLYSRDAFEGNLQNLCREKNIGVVPYYGIASGFLSGKYRSEADAQKSPRGGTVVAKYLNDRGRKILAALDSVSARLKATPAQIAIAWLIAQPAITAPIVSATNVDQLHELARAASLTLDAEAMKELDEASA